MPCRVIEIQQQVLEILYRFPPDQRIDDSPHGEGDQHPRRPPAEELARGIVNRELQITGSDDEKGHAGTRKYVQDGQPKCIGPGQDQGTFPAQVKRFAAVGDHDQEAGDDPQPVDPDFTVFVLVVHNAKIGINC